MSDWIERELKRQLAPVKAPESLWDRVADARRSKAVATAQSGWMLWPAVALIMLFAYGDLAWQIDRTHPAAAARPATVGSCGRSAGIRLTCAGGSAMAAVAHSVIRVNAISVGSCAQCHMEARL